jgi:hypothetical protein
MQGNVAAAAVEVRTSVEIAALSFINRRTAETVIDPASPPPVDCGVICGPGSGSTISDETVMLTSPPVPGPTVELAPPSMVRVPASTVTVPPGPDCGPVPEAAIWVGNARAIEHQRTRGRHDYRAGIAGRARHRQSHHPLCGHRSPTGQRRRSTQGRPFPRRRSLKFGRR